MTMSATMLDRGRLRILLLVYGDLGPRVTGPEIRGLGLARTLARRHEVTVAIGDGSGEAGDGIRVVPATRRRLAREAIRHDAFIAPSIPPYVLALKSLGSLLTITDQYDPIDLEQGTLTGRHAAAAIRDARAARRLQLAYADVVLCANDAQRRSLTGEIDSLDRRGSGPDVAVVPFGLPPAPAASSRRPLRERFPEIPPGDRIVLWWGSVWRWLDAETAIRAVAALDGVSLVITAGPPRGRTENVNDAEAARDLARSLGVLGRSVFFLDEWIPYEDRHHYLLEADAGVTLHRATPEAALAARARYMDYLWCGLPCVLARGDEWAQRFGEAGFATLVPPQEPEAVRQALSELLEEPGARAAARDAGVSLAATLSWDAAVRPLEDALERAPRPRRLRSRASLGLLGAVSAEYVRRGRDAVAT
jgi:glycosyltransferase involved in cell wall biosynthesis